MSLRHVGNYRLDSLLGSGAMGEVYKAYDAQRDRYVALKLLPPALSGDPEYYRRFQRESQVVARLTEPHVIPIHDFGEIDGQLFIDMRLVDGSDVGAQLRANGPIAPRRAVYLISQIAEALDAAHADRLIHRDIKPSNILVTQSDFVYVVDFGIARSVSGRQTALTVTGAMIGTLDYMAPERFAGHDIDGRADVYSLACLLHECLAGAPPFEGRDVPALIYAHLYSSPPSASSLVEGVPPALDDVIARGMAKDPQDRFPTADLLAAAAREAMETGAATPPLTERQSRKWDQIPASAWLPATEAEQGAAKPPGSEGKPADGQPADSGRESPTQTVITKNVHVSNGPRPPEAGPQDTGTDPDGDHLPPAVVADGPSRGHRRRGGLILAAAAAAAVAVAISVVFLVGPKSGNVSPSASTSATAKTGAAGPASSAPGLAIPTVAAEITVGQSPSYLEVAPNGKFAYATNAGAHAVTVLNTANDKVTRTINIPQGPPQFVSISDDSRTAYVSVYNTRGSVHLVVFIDTATGTETGTVQVNNIEPGPLEASPDGPYLYVPNHVMSMTSANGSRDIDVIDTASKKLVDTISVAPNPHWIVFGKNGVFYATNHMSGAVTEINSHNNHIIKEFAVGETPHSIDMSPDGRHLAVTSWNGNQVFIISTATDKVVARIPVGRLPLDISYSPDGRYLYTANNDDNTVTVIDTADNRAIATIRTGKSPTSFSVAPNGHQAYVTDEGDGTIEVLNLPS